VTIIADETDENALCVGGFIPVAALIDFSLTLSLPPRITADTGIDALTTPWAYVSRRPASAVLPDTAGHDKPAPPRWREPDGA
jgi:alcohol dehydrogenase class IV